MSGVETEVKEVGLKADALRTWDDGQLSVQLRDKGPWIKEIRQEVDALTPPPK